MKARGKLALVTPQAKPRPLTATPEIRGFNVVYRPGQSNRCPGCGRSNWYVRSMAQCAFCDTALPIAEDGQRSREDQ